ncbi:hypothetical protein TNCV_1194681 [Trichonephila clavipes]|nr:hypothetical protein TNCV_1194681 [Trichonephila clavipes]
MIYVTVWGQNEDFMTISRAMDEQTKALLEGINALKNDQEETRQEMQKVLEETRQEMQKGLEGMQKSEAETKIELKERMEKGQE